MIARSAMQRLLVGLVILAVALGLLYFIYRTSRAYISGPDIAITSPPDYAAFSTSTVTIAGRAVRVQSIALDGRPITIDAAGDFSETVLLLPGYDVETVSGADQFGHTVSKRLELVYDAPPGAPASPSLPGNASTTPASTTAQTQTL